MKLVYIGIPSRTKGYWDAFTGIIQATNYAVQNGIGCAIDPHVGSSLICRARNNITWKFLFLNKQCTHFLQIDDDVVLPKTAIVDLVNSNKNVVGGMYSLKSKAGKVAIRGLGDEIFKLKDYPNQLKEVKYLSGGCIMQTREIVQKAWDHYKNLYYLDNSDDPNLNDRKRCALYMPFIYKQEYLSEDWAYCQRLIDMGEKIWLHTGVACVHWGLAPYGIKTD